MQGGTLSDSDPHKSCVGRKARIPRGLPIGAGIAVTCLSFVQVIMSPIGHRALQFVETLPQLQRAAAQLQRAAVQSTAQQLPADSGIGTALAVRARERAMHWMTGRGASSALRRAQSGSQHLQVRTKITVVDKLPEGVPVKFVGYHGSTVENFDSIANNGVNFNLTGQNFGGYSEAGSGFYLTNQYHDADRYARKAVMTEYSDEGGWEDAWDGMKEVAAIFFAAITGKKKETPSTDEADSPKKDAAEVSPEYLKSISSSISVIQPSAAKSDDVHFYILRNFKPEDIPSGSK